jgi:hypothetical protein
MAELQTAKSQIEILLHTQGYQVYCEKDCLQNDGLTDWLTVTHRCGNYWYALQEVYCDMIWMTTLSIYLRKWIWSISKLLGGVRVIASAKPGFTLLFYYYCYLHLTLSEIPPIEGIQGYTGTKTKDH